MLSARAAVGGSDPPTLFIVGNGPGEIAGWVLPVAREVRRRQPSGTMRMTLLLAPSQFDSGTEHDVAAASALFDQIVPPREVLGRALGWGDRPRGRAGALLHLGGDLWVSRRLAARAGALAYAYVETALIARHFRAFEEIFVPAEVVKADLERRGVPPARLRVVGDPRLDALPPRGERRPGPLRVTLLPGSRERYFRSLLPLWVEAAAHLRRLQPDAEISIAVAPFIPAAAVSETVAPWRALCARERIDVRRAPAAEAMADADLVITIPGTTTMEVAALPVAALMVLPLQLIGAAPTQGLAEWLLRTPGVGPWLKRRLAPGVLARHGLVALPNRLAGREVLPELIGDLTAARIATRAAALLANERERRLIERRMVEAVGPRGASARIVERILRGTPAAAPAAAAG